MSEENRQQQSSAESTVAGAAKTGKAIASIAKGAATGGAHGAAVEAAKSSKKWIIPIVAVILLPVLIIAMLPSVIFGSLFGDGTDTPNGISDDIGMDTCYTCWLEECLTTNCLGCKRGNYPDCKWIDLKKSYQEEDK